VFRTFPFRALLLVITALPICAFGERADVTATVEVVGAAKASASAGVVVWLTPIEPADVVPPKPGHYRLTQKDKQFTPHLLVIPTGSTVDFPNLDPFFHNVFSLFNGKRFDLGLYESGSTRAVHFNHDGISYIFCNIHPEMSAVVVTLPTPYYGVSSATGSVTLPAVPPGTYQLHVWAEGANSDDLLALSRRVVVSSQGRELGAIRVNVDTHPHPHKNKFGEDYKAPEESTY
jgi:plastocyanin